MTRHDSAPIAIAFDYGGVLAHFMDEDTICHMAGAAGLSREVFAEPYWRLRPKFDSDELGAAEYWNAVLEAGGSKVDRTAAVKVLPELDAVGWGRMNTAVLRWAFTLPAAGYHCFIVSNMSTSAYKVLIERQSWARYFDPHIISGHLAINKPDPGIFEEALARTGLEAAEVLFLDDSEKNIRAARELGMKALQVSTAAKLASDLEREFPSVPRRGLLCEEKG